MTRHERDPFSFVAGLLLVAAAVTILVSSAGTHIDFAWVVPLGLGVIGTVGLLASLRQR